MRFLKVSMLFILAFVACGLLYNFLFGDPYTLRAFTKDILSGFTVALFLILINKRNRERKSANETSA